MHLQAMAQAVSPSVGGLQAEAGSAAPLMGEFKIYRKATEERLAHTVRCRAPEGCEDLAVAHSLRCVKHLTHGDLQHGVELYAVASIVYYGGHPGEFMSDAQFDGLCSWLKAGKAWEWFPWMEQDMLRAGSGYDLAKFPKELHEAAQEWLTSPAPVVDKPGAGG